MLKKSNFFDLIKKLVHELIRFCSRANSQTVDTIKIATQAQIIKKLQIR